MAAYNTEISDTTVLYCNKVVFVDYLGALPDNYSVI